MVVSDETANPAQDAGTRAGAGPTGEQDLQLAEQLPQRQADAACFGRPSRSKVRKPCTKRLRTKVYIRLLLHFDDKFGPRTNGHSYAAKRGGSTSGMGQQISKLRLDITGMPLRPGRARPARPA